MNVELLARIISAELDNGDNEQLDGIGAIDKLARLIAQELQNDENTPYPKQRFLSLCGLY